MGILILAVLLIGVVSIVRWVVVLISSSLKRKPIENPSGIAQTAFGSGELTRGNFSDFETPSFLRRGMQYPVLTEKKRGRRTRKTKPVFAAA